MLALSGLLALTVAAACGPKRQGDAAGVTVVEGAGWDRPSDRHVDDRPKLELGADASAARDRGLPDAGVDDLVDAAVPVPEQTLADSGDAEAGDDTPAPKSCPDRIRMMRQIEIPGYGGWCDTPVLGYPAGTIFSVGFKTPPSTTLVNTGTFTVVQMTGGTTRGMMIVKDPCDSDPVAPRCVGGGYEASWVAYYTNVPDDKRNQYCGLEPDTHYYLLVVPKSWAHKIDDPSFPYVCGTDPQRSAMPDCNFTFAANLSDYPRNDYVFDPRCWGLRR